VNGFSIRYKVNQGNHWCALVPREPDLIFSYHFSDANVSNVQWSYNPYYRFHLLHLIPSGIMAADDEYVPQPAHESPEIASKKCNEWVETGLTQNKAIQFLVQHLVDLGCSPPEGFIQCVSCEKPAAGGFGMVQETLIPKTGRIDGSSAGESNPCSNPTGQDLRKLLERERNGTSTLRVNPEIFICQQYMENERMAHKTLHHELIHAIDMCRTKMDPLHNCIHMACTEIRAENLSGECSFFREIPRMEKLKGHGAECVKRRAILSVRANPNCTARAGDYVNAAFDRCFADVYPFDRHPNQR
jgi:inner membrane protease ATP23